MNAIFHTPDTEPQAPYTTADDTIYTYLSRAPITVSYSGANMALKAPSYSKFIRSDSTRVGLPGLMCRRTLYHTHPRQVLPSFSGPPTKLARRFGRPGPRKHSLRPLPIRPASRCGRNRCRLSVRPGPGNAYRGHGGDRGWREEWSSHQRRRRLRGCSQGKFYLSLFYFLVEAVWYLFFFQRWWSFGATFCWIF